MRKIAKRAISLLCVLSMLFSMLVTAQSSGVLLTAGSIVVEKGTGTETVELPITISNNTGIIGMTLTVTYGEGLTLTSVKKGDAFTALTMTKPGNFSANPVKVTWDGEGENDYGNGTAVTLSFTVPKDVEKEYPIEISVSGVIDENLSKVTMSTENGKITVGSQSHTHSFGNWTKVNDTNHSRECVCGEIETGTHVWGDGIVTTPATETTTGIRTYTCSVCNGTKTEIIPKLEVETREGIKLTAGSIVVEKGTGTKTVELPITISNNTGIIGMTLTVEYGEGLTLTGVKKGDAFTALTMTKPGDFSANPVKVTWDGEGENDYGNGTAVTLSFTVPKDVEKEYPIEISVSGVIDENLSKVTMSTENGKITVGSQSHTHSFGNWTKVDENNHKRECACGETETATHTWDDGEITTPATHTTTGLKTYTCPDCSATKTETIPADADNHSFGAWEKVDDNNHKRECACGEIETKSHNWNEGTITTQPSHIEYGVRTYTCSDCNATRTEQVDKTPGHAHGAWVKDNDNTHSKSCACGDVITEAHNWDDGEVTTPATHTTTGIKTYTCSECNGTKNEVIPADSDNHTFGDWEKVDDTNHSRECACGETETAAHTWNDGEITTPATHTAMGVKTFTCEYCGATKTETIDKIPGHSYGAWVKDNDNTHSKTCACGDAVTEAHNWNDGEVTTPATHTTTGIKTYTCPDCSATKTETIPADADNHSFGAWEKVDDNNHKRECACGEIETKSHNWGEGTITTPATHTEYGERTYTCPDCNATKTEQVDKTPGHSHGAWVKDNDNTHSKTCACGDVITENHSWNDGEVTTPATHTATGIKTYTCSECNGTKTEVIPADSDNHTFGDWEKVDDTNHSRECACGETETAAHTWDDGEVTTPATHTEFGERTYTCGDCGATKTEKIDKTPTHSHGDWVKDNDTTHSKSCACGDVITENHNWNDGEVTTPATHTTTGEKTYTCGDCGATKIETIDKTPGHSHGAWVKDNDTTHSKTCACGDVITEDHNWNDGEVTTPATHTTTGVKTFTCGDCGATKTETIDKTPAHSHGTWVKDNDTTHSKSCACGDVITENHNWNDGEVTTPATHTTTGIKTYTCSECNGTKTEVIPADSDNHTFGDWEKVDDTNHSRECACGETETAAHTWDDGEVTTPATHTTTGERTYTCGDCGATKTETIDKTPGHSHGDWVKDNDTTHNKTCACGDVITEDHNWNDGEVTTHATHTTTGIKTYTCSECNGTKTEVIPADSDNHTFGDWEKVDDTNHSRECACGETETAAHNWDDGEVTTQPTYSSTGIKTYTCPDCSATKTETIPVLTHVSSGRGGVTKYTVKYETNGGNVIKSVSVRRNSVLTKPTDPTKEGFEFDGWYIDENLTEIYDFTSNVTKGFTLYAKWTEIEKEPEIIEPDKEQDFVDVSEEDWFDDSVKYVVDNNLMNGVSDKEFAPNAAVTRAMLVTVLYRNEGEPATNRSIPFADVDMDSYYGNAVSWAKQNGIVNGVSEAEFAPDANITREQIAAIMFRYAQYKGMDAVTLEENLHFTDADEISEYAVSAMNWAVGTGLMKGKSTTTINSKDNATRAEIAAILQRFIENNK